MNDVALYDQMAKDTWIASARKGFDPGEKRDCHVCARYQAVSHAHHVVPLSKQYDLGWPIPSHRCVWLCPTHHSAVHLLLSQGAAKREQLSEQVHGLLADLDDLHEMSEVLRIVAMASEGAETNRRSANARRAHADALEAWAQSRALAA